MVKAMSTYFDQADSVIKTTFWILARFGGFGQRMRDFL
jgi:lysozyme family protein